MNYLSKINKIIEYIVKTTKYSSEKEKSQVMAQLTDLFIGECLLEYAEIIKDKKKSLPQKTIETTQDFHEIMKDIIEIVGEEEFAKVIIKRSESFLKDLADFIGKKASPEYIKAYNNFVRETFQS
ncbi:hypothetical protein JW766_04480 [Candidatus Dojkabacteria bacterium]|nr:hypothetical protein [Candidatus Dojkabacteria bacterium]